MHYLNTETRCIFIFCLSSETLSQKYNMHRFIRRLNNCTIVTVRQKLLHANGYSGTHEIPTYTIRIYDIM